MAIGTTRDRSHPPPLHLTVRYPTLPPSDLNGRRGVVKKFLNAMHTGSIFLVVLDDEERGKSTKRASGKAEKRVVRRRPGYDVELSDEEEPTRVVEEVEVFPGNLREEKGGGKSSRAPNQVMDSALPASGSSTSMRWVARFVPTSSLVVIGCAS